ncbi:hypothetical protein BGZ96_005658 [Linnemannia gamsii]|uniref:5'-nucleotidase n=1 Tax=Linnemannia gamsii TaxID=64522 RepID=A0ABQ7K4F1_9FUNG|nr:hypothetical protein BGZ96_005658 [Linnemannia gamsii]
MRLNNQRSKHSGLLRLLLATTTALLLSTSFNTHVQAQTDTGLKITIIHTNDIHSRVDPANELGTACTAADISVGNCYGGFARHKTLIQKLRAARENSLLLDGGDEFQGTLYYSYYKGNVTSEIMNELGYDATTIGNHEWDDGVEVLKRFWGKLKMPVVCCNIDFSKNPELGKLVKPYTIFEKYGIGVIGYITPTTGEIAPTGPTVSFIDPVAPVQKAIDELTAKGYKRIIAVSHNGYESDMELAAKTRGLDLIVGGHSHSYLGDPKSALYQGPYPTLIKNLDGEDTLIVQAYCWGRFIGNLDIEFNPEGKIISYAGGPVLVDYSIPGDPTLLKKIDVWRSGFEAWSKKVIGLASDSFTMDGCDTRDCSIGNLFNDAILSHARQAFDVNQAAGMTTPWPDFSIVNSDGIRAGIPKGDVMVENVVTSSPFEDYAVQLPLTGQEILDMLEGVAVGKNLETGKAVTSFIQVGGLRFTYDSTKQASNDATSSPAPHIITAEIEDRTKIWRPIVHSQTYSVATLDFVMAGGDSILVEKPRPDAITLKRMREILLAYVETQKNITPYVDGRIKVVGGPGAGTDEKEVAAMKERSYLKNSEGWLPGTPGYLKRDFSEGPEQMHRAYALLRR